MTATEIRLTTPLGEIAAKAWGPTDGTRVLALHGWLDNAASFDRLAPLLPHTRLIAIDLPGHGNSYHRPPRANYHFIDWLVDIDQILDALQWPRCTLLGHSLGGAIAAIFAGVMPERVEKLVLIESIGPLTHEPEETPDRVHDFLRELKRLAGKARPLYPDAATVEALRAMAGDISPEGVRLLTARGIQPAEGGVTWASDPRLKLPSPLRLDEAQVQAFLKRITCPVLGVRAASGLKWREENTPKRIACVKNIDVKQLPGGHHLHLDDPHPVASVVNKFLRGES